MGAQRRSKEARKGRATVARPRTGAMTDPDVTSSSDPRSLFAHGQPFRCADFSRCDKVRWKYAAIAPVERCAKGR